MAGEAAHNGTMVMPVSKTTSNTENVLAANGFGIGASCVMNADASGSAAAARVVTSEIRKGLSIVPSVWKNDVPK